MLSQRLTRIFTTLALIFPLLACNISATDVLDIAELAVSEPAPLPSPTPQGDIIIFQTLNYSHTLVEGGFVPGTRMQYISANDNSTYRVQINGREATKRPSDSLAWKGIIAPGVVGEYDLRLTSAFLTNDLAALGEVTIYVLNPAPTQLPNNTSPIAPLSFETIIVDYIVPVGHTIPGTTLTYIGIAENGSAELAGTTGHPFYQQGDSFLWTGYLRDNVTLRYELNFNNVTAETIQLTGTAKLWVSN